MSQKWTRTGWVDAAEIIADVLRRERSWLESGGTVTTSCPTWECYMACLIVKALDAGVSWLAAGDTE